MMNQNATGPTRPLGRLCGMETEFALHFEQAGQGKHSTVVQADGVFDEIYRSVTHEIPAAPPQEDKKGGFLANGAAIWFETVLKGQRQGLLEVATPECEGPSALIAASQGMDRILIAATEGLERSDVRLLKNCIDPRGRAYGAQENYEVEAFRPGERARWGLRLRVLIALTYLTLALIVATPLLLIAAMGQLHVYGVPFAVLLGITLMCERGRTMAVVSLVSVLLIPKTVGVSIFCRLSRLGNTYRRLAPFLVSRVVFAGSGMLDRRGHFFLGQKASTRSADWFVWLCGLQKPIFCFNQVFKNLVAHANGKTTNLRSPRQRLCVAVGDSNMCEEAEYLRLATTTLVIDAIEAGYIEEFPELRGSIRCLKKLNRDTSLTASVPTSHGPMTAIEIQQFYLDACRRFLRDVKDAPEEAFEVLQRWSEVLYLLRARPEELFGRVDWITKRALMRHALEPGAEGEERAYGQHREFCSVADLDSLRKIDFKYHELTQQGYQRQLRDAGLVERVLEIEVPERASRLPPLSPTAALRGRYIREFASEIEWVRWDAIKLKGKDEEISFC